MVAVNGRELGMTTIPSGMKFQQLIKEESDLMGLMMMVSSLWLLMTTSTIMMLAKFATTMIISNTIPFVSHLEIWSKNTLKFKSQYLVNTTSWFPKRV
jgi:hypothetical protein